MVKSLRNWTATLSSAEATTAAVGFSSATSRERLGPLKAAIRPCALGISSTITSVMRLRVSSSIPLLALTSKVFFPRWGASSRTLSRIFWEGVTSRSISFCSTASASSLVIWSVAGKEKFGTNKLFSRRCCIAVARSAWCSQSVVVMPFFASSSARVVPQAPLPITPTDIIVYDTLSM